MIITVLSASPQSSFVTMEKGSPGVSNKIGSLAYDELSQVLQEVEGCPARTGISAISGVCQKNCEKLGIIAMIHGRHSLFFVIVQAQRLTGFCKRL